MYYKNIHILHISHLLLSVVKRNPLFSQSISCKNNEFLFTTPHILRAFIPIDFNNQGF